MRIIFMGTPEAAVPSLRRLRDDGHEIIAVWTQPDKPAGRGNKLHESPVKTFALQHGLAIHQPARIKNQEAKELFASHNADVAVVVAYGKILPSEFLQAPLSGCINLHFSLLPKYRGAAPVNWAIVHGEEKTGVTTMKIVEELDAGPILLQKATPIADTETAPLLLTRRADIETRRWLNRLVDGRLCYRAPGARFPTMAKRLHHAQFAPSNYLAGGARESSTSIWLEFQLTRSNIAGSGRQPQRCLR